jgi:RHS repeat-associated protein
MRNLIAARNYTNLRHTLNAIALGLLISVNALAQSTYATDGQTPLAMAPGAPAGSYALSGFDNVNLFNGNLNFRLPLRSVVGRGGAQMVMTLPLETHWRVLHYFGCMGLGCTPTDKYYPIPGSSWSPLTPGYSPGVLVGRRAGKDQPCFQSRQIAYTLTRLTFIAADGTEYELRDQLTEGKPYDFSSTACSGPSPDFDRGPVFVSADGTAMTFLVDSAHPITDNFATLPIVYPWGYLMLRDGTRMRIEEGKVIWLRDRNGNQINFHYDQFSRVDVITDSLNRTVNISYADTLQTPPILYDSISFKGFQGAARTIKVWTAKLHDALRNQGAEGSTEYVGVKNYHDLFPELNGADANFPNDPWVISRVTLPDGREYHFYYNWYSEIARVELPTGGAYEYDYLTTSGVRLISPPPGQPGSYEYEVYRGIIERRVYSDVAGLILDNKTTYSRVETNQTDQSTSFTTVDVNMFNGAGTLLMHEKHYFTDTAYHSFAPDAISYEPYLAGKEYLTEQYDLSGNIVRKTEYAFAQRAPVSWWSTWRFGGTPYFEPPNDTRLTDVTTTLKDVNPALVSQRHTDYDQYNNQTDLYEYDFGSGAVGSLLRRTHTGYLGGNYASDTSIHIRSLPSEQWVSTDAGGTTRKAGTTYEYDHYNQTTTEDFHAALTDRSNITGLDGSFTTSYYTRGNVSKTTRALSFDTNGNFASSVSGYAQYDIAGNMVKVIDPRSTTNNIIATTFDFSDAYGYADSTARGNETPLPVELPSTLHTYAFATKVTNALTQNAYIQYDYYLGKPVNSEDANGMVSSGRYGGFADGSYTDMLDRPTEVIVAANISSVTRRTRFTYSDSSHLITTQSDQTTLNDGVLTSTVVYDGLGRTTESRTAAPEGTIYTKQEYDGMGRVKRSYNPYLTTSDGYADTAYDALGRVTTITTSDTAAVTTVVTTTYSGNTSTVTDQAGKKRRSVTDGLGRLIGVDEPDSSGNLDNSASPPQPVQPTSYGYDALGNLIQVNQGSQQRLFTYDSLSRLKTAKNPEQVNSSGQMVETTYGYDNASNLLSKSGPNSGSSVSFTYDGLNRVKTKTLSSGGIWDYTYDTATISNAKGRLVSVVLDGGTDGYYHDGYDAMGRVTASRQVTTAGSSNTYTMSYEYDLAGHMTRQVYPSGKAFITEYDSAGRIAGVKKEAANYYAGASPTDANRIQYSAHGAVSAMKFGNQKWEHTLFNSRLQPTEIGLGTSRTDSSLLKIEYKYGVLVNNTLDTTQNNGNVQSQIITAPGLLLTQTYTYDKLNRLNDAIESGGANEWSQTYSYDRFGNRAVAGTVLDAARTPLSLTAFDTATNRIKPSVMSGFGYDTSGNVTSDPFTPPNGIVYDAENHQTNYGGSTYGYDGNGRRIKKQVGNTTTVFVYNVVGQLIAEYDNSTSPPSGSGTSYLTSDHLGSTRAVMKADGTVARHDYLPFGEEIPSSVGGRGSVTGYSTADSTRQKFTQKERDSESGLDYFLARYYSSAQGRFSSVDPLFGSTLDPQTLNRYCYVANNPLNLVDPDGLHPRDQHEFITFMMAAILKNPNANAIAQGAGDADNWQNAATGLGIDSLKGFPWVLGAAINGPKHFGKPVDKLDPRPREAGFQIHLIEDNSPGAPHQFNDPGFGFWRALKHTGQHIWGDMTGNSPDRAGKMGGWQAAWEALGGATGDFPYDLINTAVNYLNANNLEIIGIQVNGQNHGNVDFSGATLVHSSTQSGYQLNIYELPSPGNFYDDPNVQAIQRTFGLPGSNPMVEAERLYEYQVYRH